MTLTRRLFAAVAAFWLMTSAAFAQVPQYGANVSQEQAMKALAGALAEARKIGVPMAVALVDTAGQLVAFARMDNTQSASVGVAQDKAVSAAMYRRPTKVFQDAVAGGGAGLRNANAVEGGIPVTVDGKIVGAIGVSGGTPDQDGVCAAAGLAALAAK